MGDVYNPCMLRFEYDENKSAANLAKHGIDFADARRLWDDPDAMVAPTKHLGEPRYLVIGRIGAKHWTAVVTYRQGATRVISVRRSRKQEIKQYESRGV